MCAERDSKGMYAQAKNDEIGTPISFNLEYSSPENPYLVLNTERLSLQQSVANVTFYLHRIGW
jgi:adenylylsulfate kinase-like enzyme